MPTGTQTEDKDSIRSLLTAAMAQHEGGDEAEPSVEEPLAEAEAPVEAEAEPSVETAAEQSTGEGGRDKKGRFTPQPTAKGKIEPKPVAEQPAQPTQGAHQAPKPAVKPPQSWTPAAREKWATLPADVQKEVVRREREAATALQESAEDRKFAASMREKISPFEPMIRALGAETPAVVEDLLRTAYNLRTAPAHHKAAIVASIIQGQGVDPAAVSAYLQGQQPPQGAQPAAPVDPSAIADQVRQQVMKDFEARQAQERAQQHQAEVEAFAADPAHEFFDDVQPRMAALIAAHAQQGLPMSLQEAYDAACKLDPNVSAALQQREAARQANANIASTQRAKIASSSIRSQPAGAATAEKPEPEDLRGALEAAWAAHEGRR